MRPHPERVHHAIALTAASHPTKSVACSPGMVLALELFADIVVVVVVVAAAAALAAALLRGQ